MFTAIRVAKRDVTKGFDHDVWTMICCKLITAEDKGNPWQRVIILI